jgi:hypothetical protein
MFRPRADRLIFQKQRYAEEQLAMPGPKTPQQFGGSANRTPQTRYQHVGIQH